MNWNFQYCECLCAFACDFNLSIISVSSIYYCLLTFFPTKYLCVARSKRKMCGILISKWKMNRGDKQIAMTILHILLIFVAGYTYFNWMKINWKCWQQKIFRLLLFMSVVLYNFGISVLLWIQKYLSVCEWDHSSEWEIKFEIRYCRANEKNERTGQWMNEWVCKWTNGRKLYKFMMMLRLSMKIGLSDLCVWVRKRFWNLLTYYNRIVWCQIDSTLK